MDRLFIFSGPGDGLLLAGGAAVLLIAVAAVLWNLFRTGGRFGKPPYERAKLLTGREAAFYPALRDFAARRGYLLLLKVRMADLVQVRKGFDHRTGWFFKVASKHADFVLCAWDSLEVAAVVELDDPSHDRPDRIRRDSFVDAAYKAAGIPIVHVRGETGAALEALLLAGCGGKSTLAKSVNGRAALPAYPAASAGRRRRPASGTGSAARRPGGTSP